METKRVELHVDLDPGDPSSVADMLVSLMSDIGVQPIVFMMASTLIGQKIMDAATEGPVEGVQIMPPNYDG